MYKDVSLGEVATIVTGKTPSTKDPEMWAHDMPFITPRDLQSMKHVTKTERYVSKKAANKHLKQMLPAGSVCVSCIGNLGYVGIATGPALSNQQINSLVPNNSRDSDYLYYAMKYLWPHFKHMEGQSTTLSIINKGQFAQILIPWPSFEKRQYIAAKLSAFDDLIECNARTNGYLYECCTAKMIDIVSSSDRTMTVGECCESIYSGGTPSTKKAAYWNGNLPWLSSGETRCRFIIDTEKTITELGVAESSTKLAKAGDVVMASAGQGFTRGQTSMLFFDTYVNQSVVVMRPKRDYGAYLLLMLAAQYDNLRAWSDSTSTRGSMSGKLLRQFELPYFDVEQAKELTAFTAPMFAMIENNMRESKALAQTRDALLPKLMSGEIDVSEVELPKQLNSHLSGR
jgi:type I restriction enzyme S subunit